MLYIVGRVIAHTEQGNVWDFMGLFDSEAAAVAACRSEDDFVGPLEMNVLLGEERTEWPGAYYPKWKSSTED